jgi:hypothetical protein
VHQIVAPAIQLHAGIRRPIELEEARIHGMVVGDLVQSFRPEDTGDLGLERFGEQAIDIVVAVIHEQETAATDVALQIAPLGGVNCTSLWPAK